MPMSQLRQRIAERLVLAKSETAMLTTFNEADMTNVLELRKRYKPVFKDRHQVDLGFMSFFVKAVVDALQTVPQVNAQIQGNEIVQNHFYDIGVAVGTDRGLVVPVVRDCDKLSFAQLEKAIGELARKVRDKTITLADLSGGVFTVSNGGVYGSLLSTPILNPPQCGILGMHAIKKRPVVVDDQIVVRPMMYLALSYDHRLVDGREAVTFLRRVVDCVESPERMMLEI
jgi:2-oxoglutarate dehydrogenase E2 component (dihydrolipoamide succinyltransferase)